nr:immunoglobulin heavy chain junction region [Mus musculus]MBK4183682.1 immunoglobulin heavy chain junction region [Mus musculus]
CASSTMITTGGMDYW